MNTRAKLLSLCSLTAVAAIAWPLSSSAADLGAQPPLAPAFTRSPAVDGMNGKAELFGGGGDFQNFEAYNPANFNPYFGMRNNWRAEGGATGSFSAPLAREFGVQVDGLLAQWNGQLTAGGGAHLFWRDPTKALLGVYGSGLFFDHAGGISLGRAAAEGEIYFGPWTVQGLIGGEFGQRSGVASAAIGLAPFGAPYLAFDCYDLQTRFFDKVSLGYYLMDNLKFSVGHIYTGGRNAAALGAEYLVPASTSHGAAASLFVEGRVGERQANSVVGGLRIYFGAADKALIRRHREDDPENHLKDDLFTLSNSHRTSTTPLPVSTPATPAAPPT
jgi:hypothetical protein